MRSIIAVSHRKKGVGRWGAWRCTAGRHLGVGKVKGRKSLALYIERNGRKRPVAYFHDQEDADEVMELLGDLALGQEGD
jgi:hypothetical protein